MKKTQASNGVKPQTVRTVVYFNRPLAQRLKVLQRAYPLCTSLSALVQYLVTEGLKAERARETLSSPELMR